MADTRRDRDLIAALADGDRGALRTLYDRHAPWLLLRLGRRCSDPSIVEDACRTPLSLCGEKARGYSGAGEVAAWIWGIGVRRLIQHLRHAKNLAPCPRVDPTRLCRPRTRCLSASNTATLGARCSGCRRSVSGGKKGSNPATATVEVIDLSASNPTWGHTGTMHHARLLHNLTLLADGSVAGVGGGAAFKYTGPQKMLEIYDPISGAWTDMLAEQGGRMYHSTSLLLPDGTLWSAGQDNGDFKTRVEVYSPPYLFRGPRPTISSAPQNISYNANFTINTPDAAAISKVALVHPGSVRHQLDPNSVT